MLNIFLTTFLVCPLIIGTSVEERAPERTFATSVWVTRPQSREECSKGARGVMGRKAEKFFLLPITSSAPLQSLWEYTIQIVISCKQNYLDISTYFVLDLPLSIWLETLTKVPLLSTGLLPRLQRNMSEYFPKHILVQYVWEWTCLAVRIVSIIC